MINPKFAQHLRLYSYWDSKRDGRTMPARADIDPAGLGTLLPYVTLMEVVGDRYRYRVMGSRVVDDLGRDYTGTFVGDHSTPDYAVALIGLVSRVCTGREPLFATGRYRMKEKVGRVTSRLFLPLGADGETVDMVIITRIAETARGFMATNWEQATSASIDCCVAIADGDDLRRRCLEWEAYRAPQAA